MSLLRVQDAFILAGTLIGTLGVLLFILRDRSVFLMVALRTVVGAVTGLAGGIIAGLAVVVLELAILLFVTIRLAVAPLHSIALGKTQVLTFLELTFRFGFYIAGAGLVIGLFAGFVWGDTGPQQHRPATTLVTRRNLLLALGALALMTATVFEGGHLGALYGVLVLYALCMGAVMDTPSRARFGHTVKSAFAVLAAADLAELPRALPPMTAGADTVSSIALLSGIALIFGYFGYVLFNPRVTARAAHPSRLRLIAWSLAGLGVGGAFSGLTGRLLSGPVSLTFLGCVVGVFIALGSPDGRALLAVPKERFIALPLDANGDPKGVAGLGTTTQVTQWAQVRLQFDRRVARRRFWNSFLVGICFATVTMALIIYWLASIRGVSIIPAVFGKHVTIKPVARYPVFAGASLLFGASYAITFGLLNAYRNAAYHALTKVAKDRPDVIATMIMGIGTAVAALPAIILYLFGADG